MENILDDTILTLLSFPKWIIFKKQNYTTNNKLCGVISYGIHDDVYVSGLVAYWGWTNNGTRNRKSFPLSQEGYEQAIHWIEQGRKKLIFTLM